MHGLAADLDHYLRDPRWYQNQIARTSGLPAAIAYFSMEFGVTEVLPNYSGGLGILAGDHLKSASDLGVPIVGVGLLYRFGYFWQSLSSTAGSRSTIPRTIRRACRSSGCSATDGAAVRQRADARRPV